MERENQCKRITRFRLKNEVGEEKYWKGEDKMRLCEGGEGEHGGMFVVRKIYRGWKKREVGKRHTGGWYKWRKGENGRERQNRTNVKEEYRRSWEHD